MEIFISLLNDKKNVQNRPLIMLIFGTICDIIYLLNGGGEK